ncbi:alpha-glycosidase [Bacillus horti]|uniref:Glycosidase n=1 Tax=Caldalkalibacillus horti TaxID=77523 RepID=A0ABT9VTH0_9BACI|nr:alpha-glycosidase [Bacillus horti]MDQ0164268.1 glycosidase [Bacillus horti]
MIMLEAVYHRIGQNWSYAYSSKTLHIRIRTKRGNVSRIELICGDKYSWDKFNEVIEMDLLSSDGLFDYWQAAVQPAFRRLVYYFVLYSDHVEPVYYLEKGFYNDPPTVTYEGLFDFPFLNSEDVHMPPEWVKDTVFYQIFPERFANGDLSNDPENTLEWGGTPSPSNFFGGDLQGIMDHLDYLSELGINAIYFNPLFAATTNHKYDTMDYFNVDPHFGTNEKLKELIIACHARGIRVLLDGVFNHCGHTFPPFVDVLANGQSSRYADWFHVHKWPLEVVNGTPTYDTFGFEPIMPKLNTGNDEVKEYLISVGRYWIEEIGIDGWRLDVANEVDHQFWREFRREIKKSNPSAYILGEIMHDSMPWLQGDQFDAVMNYPFTNILLNFFAHRRTNANQFAQAINTQLVSYPQQITEVSFNLLGSHDTVRLLTLCGGNVQRMKLATLFQLTFQGTPCIYYGDEIGLIGQHDPDNRKCMEWDTRKQNLDLFAFFRQMINLRKSHAALRGSGLKFLPLPEHTQILAYERWDDRDRFLFVLNNEDASVSIVIPALQPSKWRSVESPATIHFIDGEVHMSLPPYGYAILHTHEEDYRA